MNAPANVPAQRRELAPIEVLKNIVARKADDFKMVLPSHITVDKFQRTIATAALSNPQLLTCDRQSLLVAAMKLAQDGLLPDGREAALVPFKSYDRTTKPWTEIWQVQAMPMAWGLRKKILQSGQVISLETGVVYRAEAEEGHFIYEIGLEPPIRHRPKLDMADEDMTDDNIVAAYSIARIKNESGGDPYWSVEVMRRSEINKVRQASQTGAVGRTYQGGPNKGKPIPPKGPWVDWFSEMARKTVLRRHSKVLPMSGDILDTFDRDDAEELRAQGAARLLEAEEQKPVSLPRNEDFDPDTGEVVEQERERQPTDSRGMTEVDEETARALDAGEQEGDAAPEATFYGEAMPAKAEPGDTWWNGEKLRYAHDKGQHGIKWYLAPPEEETQAQAAERTARDIDGPLEDTSGNDVPMWLEKVEGLQKKLRAAKSIKAVDGIERDWLNLIRPAVDDDDAVAAFEREIAARKRELREAGEG